MQASQSDGWVVMDDHTQGRKRVEQIVSGYVKRLYNEIETRIGRWSVDLTQHEVHEVVGGLLARQATLGIQLASSPGIWNTHVAPVILRTMVDTLITVAWIVADPVDRARKFILHGLGEEKLAIKHRSERLKKLGRNPESDSIVQQRKAWLESQRFLFLTEINLGSWSGISTRKMAEQSGYLELYRSAFTPYSAATHSMWHHIGRYNLVYCESPLHRHHRLPWVYPDTLDAHYLQKGAEYVEETFRKFEAAFELDSPKDTALAFFKAEVGKLGTESEE